MNMKVIKLINYILEETIINNFILRSNNNLHINIKQLSINKINNSLTYFLIFRNIIDILLNCGYEL